LSFRTVTPPSRSIFNSCGDIRFPPAAIASPKRPVGYAKAARRRPGHAGIDKNFLA
jgi:hypothetical protein